MRKICTCRVSASAQCSAYIQVRVRVRVRTMAGAVSTVTDRASISPLLVGSVTQLMTFNGGEKHAD